ncbi:hypothetical protein AK812_SmicGene44485 [Symbiodinium microadriaticum]|uniref:Uncharacterized protein n=1 Tax=Symbiodinium microadriaticum TaxID=2951 RepID=A0A1Q9BYM1_SYMMI|nr:hypothetical protein AK812_SmicGene44485 [Symbiodinium microadriaticum]
MMTVRAPGPRLQEEDGDDLRTCARMLPDSHRTQHRPVESVHAALRSDVAKEFGEEAEQAAAEIIPELVQEEGNYVVTTDLGNEFRGLEAALPGGVVHRQKNPTDRNATAVVDRAIQTLLIS